MGKIQSTLKAVLTAQRGDVKCVPYQPYQPFPEHMHETGEGGLVLQIRALPAAVARYPIPEDTFWWMDAQFLPYNDAQLVVSSTAYTPRLVNSWISVKRVPRGRILLYDMSFKPVKGHIFTGTESSVYPKVQPHPSGEAIGYAGTAEVRVDSLMNEKLFSRPRDLDNRSQRFCAISPNGTYLAVLSRAHGFYYLEVFHLDSHFISSMKPVPLHKLKSNFLVSRAHYDHVECKWSPDGSHLAISNSHGNFLLIKEPTTSRIAAAYPDCIPGKLSAAGAYDFDPSVQFSIMAVGLSDRILAIIQSDAKMKEEIIIQQTETNKYVDCVQYSHDGSSVAVSFRTFEVNVYSSEDLSTLHSIDMTELCSHHATLYQDLEFPTVHRLSFSYDGRYLATSSCDGHVRVWSIPRLLTLQEWCRKKILQHIPIVSVRKSSLPQKMKSFLLSEYF